MMVKTLENEIKASRHQRRGILWLGLFLLLFTLLNSLVLRSQLPILSSIGPQGTLGVEGKQGIQGTQGQQGVQGLQGVTGIKGDTGPTGAAGTPGLPGVQGAPGPQGETGAPGDPGQPGREVEFRHNDAKNRTEWRYVGDQSWTVLMYDCEITDTCP